MGWAGDAGVGGVCVWGGGDQVKGELTKVIHVFPNFCEPRCLQSFLVFLQCQI